MTKMPKIPIKNDGKLCFNIILFKSYDEYLVVLSAARMKNSRNERRLLRFLMKAKGPVLKPMPVFVFVVRCSMKLEKGTGYLVQCIVIQEKSQKPFDLWKIKRAEMPETSRWLQN